MTETSGERWPFSIPKEAMSIGSLSFPHANESPNFNRKASLCKLNSPRGCQYLKNAYTDLIMLPLFSEVINGHLFTNTSARCF